MDDTPQGGQEDQGARMLAALRTAVAGTGKVVAGLGRELAAAMDEMNRSVTVALPRASSSSFDAIHVWAGEDWRVELTHDTLTFSGDPAESYELLIALLAAHRQRAGLVDVSHR